MRRGQGGVAAEIDLDRRRHPAQVEVIAAFDHEGGLGEIVLGRDRLQLLVRQKFLEQANPSRVAGKHPVGESEDLEIRNRF